MSQGLQQIFIFQPTTNQRINLIVDAETKVEEYIELFSEHVQRCSLLTLSQVQSLVKQ